MRRWFFIAAACLSLLFAGCGSEPVAFDPIVTADTDRTAAVIEIAETERSKIELPETASSSETAPTEVLATATSPEETRTPPVTEEPKEYFTVKFVDSDGYTALSVQTVVQGGSASPPAVDNAKGDLLFRGWDKDYTNVQKSMIVRAIYQKEILTVNFYDIDGTLLKTEQVHYGEDATPPEVGDRAGYAFNGWSILFSEVTEDLDVYATYYIEPQRKSVPLSDAYSYIPVSENILSIPITAYYRKNYTGTLTMRNKDYTGNILYGNFSDAFAVENYPFKSFEGTLFFKGLPSDTSNTYALRFYIYCDGVQVFSTELTRADTAKDFSVPLSGVKELTIHLEPLMNDFIYYENPEFTGGLVGAAFYEE